MIETKWQHIARRYLEIGDVYRAGIADMIDALLESIAEYDRTTEEWDSDVDADEVEYMPIADIVTCIDYCTACVYHSTTADGCGGCIFANRGGIELFRSIKSFDGGE